MKERMPLRSLTHEMSADFSVEKLFNILKDPSEERVSVKRLLSEIERSGIPSKDLRLSETMQILHNHYQTTQADPDFFDRSTFEKCVLPCLPLFYQIVENNFVIPQWKQFEAKITEIFHSCMNVTEEDGYEGEVTNYLPQLARVDPDLWSMSICTVDGQRMSLGNGDNVKFTMQASQYPLAYSLALHETSDEYVHSHVGHEPSGLPYTAMSLNDANKPHNPMINAGAMVIASLLLKQESLATAFDHVTEHYTKMAGGEYVGFNNGVCLAERDVSHRNFALGHILMQNNCFPPDTRLQDVMDFYFQLCSIEVDCAAGSIMAATLANGGICPLTNDRQLNSQAVRHTLSLMHSCGMYDFSGEFAFRVGLPAKSSISGAILLVVPNVMGICLYSPRLNRMNNSLKGSIFCEKLVSEFNFHNYDSLIQIQQKVDPRRRPYEPRAHLVVSLLFSAFNNDVTALKRVMKRGVDMNMCDYDGRTALHIAAAEGHIDVVKFLVETAKVVPHPKDRWDFTPKDDAVKFHRDTVVQYFTELAMQAVNLE